MPARRVFRAVLQLPVMATVAIPAMLLLATRSFRPAWALHPLGGFALAALGLALIGAGAGLLAWTVGLFWRVGQGSLAP